MTPYVPQAKSAPLVLTPPRWAQTFREVLLWSGFLPACFLCFVLVRVVVLVLVPVVPTSDGEWYVMRAMEIAAGEGYHEGPWPTAFWPVGYPLFLAGVFWILGPNVLAAQIINLAISCAIFVAMASLTRRLFGREDIARLSVAILTLYPNHIAYTGVLFSENLATLLLLLGCCVFFGRETPMRALAAGLIFGLAAIVKAQFVLLAPLIAVLYGFAAWKKGQPKRRVVLVMGLLGIGTIVTIAPLTWRNYQALHEFIPISTNGGVTFLTGNNPDAQGDFTPRSALVESLHRGVEHEFEYGQRAYKLGVDWIRANPTRFLQLLPMKVWRLWAPDGEAEWWFQRGYAEYDNHVLAFRTLRYFNQAYYAGILLAAFAGVITLIRMKPFRPQEEIEWGFFGMVFCLFLTVISMVYSGQSRFHFPAMQFLIGYAAVFLVCQAEKTLQRAQEVHTK